MTAAPDEMIDFAAMHFASEERLMTQFERPGAAPRRASPFDSKTSTISAWVSAISALPVGKPGRHGSPE